MHSLKTNWLSLKRGFGGCGQGFDGCDGLGGLGGFDGFGSFCGFSGFGGFDRLGGFDGFSGFGGFERFLSFIYSTTKGFISSSKLFSELLGYTWLKGEQQISRKERYSQVLTVRSVF